MNFTYEHAGQQYHIDLKAQPDGSYQVMIDGRSYRVEAQQLPDGGWRLRIDGQSVQAYAVAREQTRFVKLDAGPALAVTLPDSRTRRRKASTGAEGQLIAQMPGQVVEVLVQPGDAVQAGQTLALLEAMKMEIRVSAPRDGVVKAVQVRKGDVVERDQLLIALESEREDASSTAAES